MKLLIPLLLITSYLWVSELKSSANDMTSNEIISNLMSNNIDEVNRTLSYISTNKPNNLLSEITKIVLEGENTNTKLIAVNALKCYPIKNILPLWLNILKKTHSFIVKKEIINFISKSHDKRIVLPLIEELYNPFYSVRESAIHSLKIIGDDRMFPYILNMLKKPNPVYRIYALEAIYHVYDIRVIGLIIDILKKDKNKSVRYYTLRCILKNKIKKTLPYVRNIALNDINWEVRVKAIEILNNFRDKKSLNILLKCLKDINHDIRLASANTLYAMKLKKSAPSLSKQLFKEKYDEIKEILIDTLIALKNAGGYKGLKYIIQNDRNVYNRIKVAYALGKIKHKKSISVLLKGISDIDPRVRAEICKSLGYYKDKKIVARLLMLINDDLKRYVKSAALYSIKKIGDKKVILPLFDRYCIETDPILKGMLKKIIRKFIKRYT